MKDLLSNSALEDADLLSRRRLPQADGPVEAAAGQMPAVRRKRDGFDKAFMLRQRDRLFARDDIPDARHGAAAPRDESPAVRGERERHHREYIPRQTMYFPPAAHVPQV